MIYKLVDDVQTKNSNRARFLSDDHPQMETWKQVHRCASIACFPTIIIPIAFLKRKRIYLVQQFLLPQSSRLANTQNEILTYQPTLIEEKNL